MQIEMKQLNVLTIAYHGDIKALEKQLLWWKCNA